MMNRKRSFLSSYEWKTIPWCGLEKTPKDTLMDVLVDIPELLEELDALYSLCYTETSSNRYHAFLGRITDFERELQSWYDHTSEANPWLSTDTLLSHNEVGLAAAHLKAVYWTARLVLVNIRGLPQFPYNEAFEHTNAETLQAKIMPLLARLTENHSGWFGKQAAVFPGGAVRCLIKGISNKVERDSKMGMLIMLFRGMQSTAISPAFLGCKREMPESTTALTSKSARRN